MAQERKKTVHAPDAWSKLCKQSLARLLQKVYEVDPIIYPKCQGAMSVVAIITTVTWCCRVELIVVFANAHGVIEDPKELPKIIDCAMQQERVRQRTSCARSLPELALVSV